MSEGAGHQPTADVRVDSHAHVFLAALPMAAARRYTPGYDAPLSTYLGHLDRHGLTHGVLVQPSFLGTDNSFMLQALEAAGGRLRGVAVVDQGVGDESLAAMDTAGVVGVRLNLIGQTAPDVAAPAWQHVWDFVRSRGWHVEVHAPAGELAVTLQPLLDQRVQVVVDHFGRPDPAQGLADPGFRTLLNTADSGRVWVKLSAGYRLGTDPALPRQAAAALLTAFGVDRLVWGSDWPHTGFEAQQTYDAAAQGLNAWLLQPGAQRAVLGATAARLFHIAS